MIIDLTSVAQLGMAIGTLAAVAWNTYEAKVTKAENKENHKTIKDDLRQATETSDRKLDELHALANSSMASQKKLAAQLAEEVAELTGNSKHIARAQTLRKLFDTHMANQEEADRGASR
jgi:hypothetical protein